MIPSTSAQSPTASPPHIPDHHSNVNEMSDEELYDNFIRTMFDFDDNLSTTSTIEDDDDDYTPATDPHANRFESDRGDTDDGFDGNEEDDIENEEMYEPVNKQEVRDIVHGCFQTLANIADTDAYVSNRFDHNLSIDKEISNGSLNNSNISYRSDVQPGGSEENERLSMPPPKITSKMMEKLKLSQSQLNNSIHYNDIISANASTNRKKSVLMHNAVNQLLCGQNPSDISINDVPIEVIRNLTSRQMAMSFQILIQILFLCYAKERSEVSCTNCAGINGVDQLDETTAAHNNGDTNVDINSNVELRHVHHQPGTGHVDIQSQLQQQQNHLKFQRIENECQQRILELFHHKDCAYRRGRLSTLSMKNVLRTLPKKWKKQHKENQKSTHGIHQTQSSVVAGANSTSTGAGADADIEDIECESVNSSEDELEQEHIQDKHLRAKEKVTFLEKHTTQPSTAVDDDSRILTRTQMKNATRSHGKADGQDESNSGMDSHSVGAGTSTDADYAIGSVFNLPALQYYNTPSYLLNKLHSIKSEIKKEFTGNGANEGDRAQFNVANNSSDDNSNRILDAIAKHTKEVFTLPYARAYSDSSSSSDIESSVVRPLWDCLLPTPCYPIDSHYVDYYKQSIPDVPEEFSAPFTPAEDMLLCKGAISQGLATSGYGSHYTKDHDGVTVSNNESMDTNNATTNSFSMKALQDEWSRIEAEYLPNKTAAGLEHRFRSIMQGGSASNTGTALQSHANGQVQLGLNNEEEEVDNGYDFDGSHFRRCILLARKKGVSKYQKFTLEEDIQLLKGFHVYGSDSINLWSNISMCFLSHRTARECKYRWAAIQKEWAREQAAPIMETNSNHLFVKKNKKSHNQRSVLLHKQGTKVDGSLVSHLTQFLKEIGGAHTYNQANNANPNKNPSQIPPVPGINAISHRMQTNNQFPRTTEKSQYAPDSTHRSGNLTVPISNGSCSTDTCGYIHTLGTSANVMAAQAGSRSINAEAGVPIPNQNNGIAAGMSNTTTVPVHLNATGDDLEAIEVDEVLDSSDEEEEEVSSSNDIASQVTSGVKRPIVDIDNTPKPFVGASSSAVLSHFFEKLCKQDKGFATSAGVLKLKENNKDIQILDKPLDSYCNISPNSEKDLEPTASDTHGNISKATLETAVMSATPQKFGLERTEYQSASDVSTPKLKISRLSEDNKSIIISEYVENVAASGTHTHSGVDASSPDGAGSCIDSGSDGETEEYIPEDPMGYSNYAYLVGEMLGMPIDLDSILARDGNLNVDEAEEVADSEADDAGVENVNSTPGQAEKHPHATRKRKPKIINLIPEMNKLKKQRKSERNLLLKRLSSIYRDNGKENKGNIAGNAEKTDRSKGYVHDNVSMSSNKNVNPVDRQAAPINTMNTLPQNMRTYTTNADPTTANLNKIANTTNAHVLHAAKAKSQMEVDLDMELQKLKKPMKHVGNVMGNITNPSITVNHAPSNHQQNLMKPKINLSNSITKSCGHVDNVLNSIRPNAVPHDTLPIPINNYNKNAVRIHETSDDLNQKAKKSKSTHSSSRMGLFESVMKASKQ